MLLLSPKETQNANVSYVETRNDGKVGDSSIEEI